jgi:lysophospholipase L1-like esterase
MLRRILSSFVVLGLLLAVARPAAAEFPLKDGDIWVMAGDSITAQHQHSNYFEAFCFARYPQLRFGFRNSGVGGHTIPTTLARFDYDIAAWKPTVVSVELGMNDQGGTPTDKFIANMKTMLERIGSISARPVILTASPVNDGTAPPKSTTQNRRLSEYAVELKKLAEERKIPFADQFHPLVVIWAKNKPDEMRFNALRDVKTALTLPGLAGKEHLQAFLEVQAKLPNQPLTMQGDPVHPGPNGQLMMAAELLKGLGAEAFVSSAALDASGKIVEAKGCTIADVKLDGDKLAFSRLDESLPFPIPDGTVDVLPLCPTIEEMSLYMLKVDGLKPGDYTVKIGGAALAPKFTAEELAKGVNLTAAVHTVGQGSNPNPILIQSRAILQAVGGKAGLVNQWRTYSKQMHEGGLDHKQKITELLPQIAAADEKIRTVAKPTKLQFEISPSK